MFEGMKIGRTDHAGRDICCGDRILFHEHLDATRVTSHEDGWGRDIPLCRHDKFTIPAQDKDYTGTVVYDQNVCQFQVKWDEKHNISSWGSNQHTPRQGYDDLFGLLVNHGKGCTFTVIETGEPEAS